MTKDTYSIEEGVETRILIEEYNDQGKIIYSKDFTDDPVQETKFEYNEQNQLICERIIQDGIEINRKEFHYNPAGEIIKQDLLFNGSIYESIILENEGNMSIRKIIQDGIEVERTEEERNGENWVISFYSHSEHIETHTSTYDKLNNSRETKISIVGEKHDSLNQRNEKYDFKDRLIEFKEYSAKGDLLIESYYSYDNNYLIKEEHKEHYGSGYFYYIDYQYDHRGNLKKTEKRTTSDNLLSFHTCQFDDKDRVIEESGLISDNPQNMYGAGTPNNNTHLRHYYS